MQGGRLKQIVFYSITTSLLLLFVSLSIWQWNRGFAKQRQLDQFHQQRLSLTKVPLSINPQYDYQSIELYGSFDNEHYFFLDNRFYQHQPGYEIIQVLHVAHNLPILVNRGFISHQGQRRQWPTISLITVPVTIQGRLYHPQRGIQLAAVDDTPHGWPKLIQNIDFDAIATKLGYPIAPYVIMLNPESPYSYPTAWQPTTMSPARHWGYAVQWGLLACMVIIATLIFSTRCANAK